MSQQSVRRVAVIGAGISGVVSAGHLLAAGVSVTVFERNQAAGGVWLYDDRKPLEPVYPSTRPSEAENPGEDSREDKERRLLEHAPPGPCYWGLSNNVSTPLLRVKLNAWPEGTPDFVNHQIMQEYIQDTSKKAGVDEATIYGARVKNVYKEGSTWHVTWSTFSEDVAGRNVEREESSTFDAVIVASGHYHAPRIPDIPGLSESKAQWPSRIIHSKAYRKPEGFEGKNILLIGGGVSSTDIAREIGPVAQNVYQSTRNGAFDLSSSLLPERGVRISEVASFELQKDAKDPSQDEHLPLVVHLKSGQKLCGIDGIVICTGYHITLPFLHKYHDDETLPAEASETVLVTDGTQVHNLHSDIFYIPDPTLAFVGVPYYTATFTLFEFQAIAVAAVFSGVAKLPSEAQMKEEYNERIKKNGSGRGFHSLKDIEEYYVRDILGWINASRADQGLPPIEGHTDTWIQAKAAQRERVRAIFETCTESGNRELPVLEVCS